ACDSLWLPPPAFAAGAVLVARCRSRVSLKPRKGSAMRQPIRELLLSAALLCAVSARGDAQAQAPTPEATTITQKTVPNFVPVTDAMLRAPKPEDWLLYRGNYQGWGYSPLEQINKI